MGRIQNGAGRGARTAVPDASGEDTPCDAWPRARGFRGARHKDSLRGRRRLSLGRDRATDEVGGSRAGLPESSGAPKPPPSVGLGTGLSFLACRMLNPQSVISIIWGRAVRVKDVWGESPDACGRHVCDGGHGCWILDPGSWMLDPGCWIRGGIPRLGGLRRKTLIRPEAPVEKGRRGEGRSVSPRAQKACLARTKSGSVVWTQGRTARRVCEPAFFAHPASLSRSLRDSQGRTRRESQRAAGAATALAARNRGGGTRHRRLQSARRAMTERRIAAWGPRSDLGVRSGMGREVSEFVVLTLGTFRFIWYSLSVEP